MSKETKKVKAAAATPVIEAPAKQETPFIIYERNTLLSTTKAIETAMIKANKAASNVQQEYQLVVCSAILHLATHKDIRVIRNLLDTMPEGIRKASMAAFIDKFAPVTFDEQGKVSYNNERKLDLNGALNMPWWKAKKEEVYRPVDTIAALTRVLKQVEKRLKDGANAEEGDNVSPEHVAILNETINRLKREANPEQQEATAQAA